MNIQLNTHNLVKSCVYPFTYRDHNHLGREGGTTRRWGTNTFVSMKLFLHTHILWSAISASLAGLAGLGRRSQVCTNISRNWWN